MSNMNYKFCRGIGYLKPYIQLYIFYCSRSLGMQYGGLSHLLWIKVCNRGNFYSKGIRIFGMEWRRRFNENLAGIARPLTHSLRHKNVIWAISYMPAYVKSPIPTHYNSPLPSNLRPKGNSIIVTVHAWIIERNAMSTLIPKKIQNFHHRWRCSLACLIANCINIFSPVGGTI